MRKNNNRVKKIILNIKNKLFKKRIIEKKYKKVYYAIIFFMLMYLIFIIYNIYIINISIDKIKNEIKNKQIINKILNEEILKIKKNKTKKIEYDMKDDYSITKFISGDIPFNDKLYIPSDLEKLNGEYIVDTKGYSTLRKEAIIALNNMSEAFYKDLEEKIFVVSAYRSYNYQKRIKDGGCPDNLCAKAGYSEHQTGLAVDLWSASTQKEWTSNPKNVKYYNWLDKNAHKYGFINTYTKGFLIDTYEIEPWHWRYVGIDLATQIKESNLSFAEFYNTTK